MTIVDTSSTILSREVSNRSGHGLWFGKIPKEYILIVENYDGIVVGMDFLQRVLNGRNSSLERPNEVLAKLVCGNKGNMIICLVVYFVNCNFLENRNV